MPKKQDKKTWALLLFVFGTMLVLNHLTPYLADDFTFSYSFADRDTLHSPYILFRSLFYHYFEWSGRVVVKFFAQLFTIPPKAVFDCINAAAFVCLGLVLAKLSDTGEGRKGRLLTLGFAFLSLWLVSPVFGQVNLWMCGSCNNLWSTLGCMAFLLPWRHLFAKPLVQNPYTVPLFFVDGVLAGWLYENTSAGMIFCMVLCFGWAFLQRRRVPLWSVAAFLGSCIGYCFLIFAPGNSVRTDDSSAAVTFDIWQYLLRFKKTVFVLIRYGWPLLLIFIVLLLVLVLRQKAPLSSLAWPCILFLSGIAANFAMIASPVYYLRSSHGPFTLLTAACCALLAQLRPELKKQAGRLCTLAAVWAAVVLVFASYDILQYNKLYQQRDAEIRSEVAAGKIHIATYAISPNTVYCGAWGLPDIRETEDWISMTRCMWYGLDGLGLRTGVQATITADPSAPLTYSPLFGLAVGSGDKD